MVYLNGGRKSPDNKQVKKRALHVDIIKGWAMLTIIIFHCSATFFPSITSGIIGNPWNVPVFFIIAYVISGVASSFAIIYTFRGIKELILKMTKK